MHHRTNGFGPGQSACASCKHQRKRCDEKCVLSPYFPADRTLEFQAVHRVFGVSNVSKMVQRVAQEHRKKVAESLIWEATWRQRDPVHGAYSEYKRVQDELNYYKGVLKHQIQGSALLNKFAPSARALHGWTYGNNNNSPIGPNGAYGNNNGSISQNGVSVAAVTDHEVTGAGPNYVKESRSSVVESSPYSCVVHDNAQPEIVNGERETANTYVGPHQYWVNGITHQQQYSMSGNNSMRPPSRG